jgi:hypothetical protein
MATQTAAGIGRKKPQVDISIGRLDLDPQNPRLAEEAQGTSQEELIVHMFDNFELDEIAESMAKNGYFDEEPLVAIPKNLPKKLRDRAYRKTSAGAAEFKDFIESEATEFVVAEGNRRLATAKLLYSPELRARLKRGRNWPTPAPEVIDDLSVLPVIVYPERLDVLPYLGVRHITGNKKWDSYAKARYINEMIQSGKTIEDVEKDVGDKGQAVRKSAISYNLLRVARDELDYDISRAKTDFSLLLLALGQKGTKRFLGWEKTVGEKTKSTPLSEIDLQDPIDDGKLNQLESLLEFLYGNARKKLLPAIRESRDITNHLSVVLNDEAATKHLIKTWNLQEAYELTDGEEALLQRLLSQANTKLERALGFAHRHKTVDVIDEAKKCLETATQLNKVVGTEDV